jgi:hypothetical protein
VPAAVWVGLMIALAVWTAGRIGLFAFWGEVPLAGEIVRLPNGFAGVDHPFHAIRAETLRRALADGHLLRWVGHHQGGYPVEFYPLGVAWLEVGLWGLLLGTLPMVVVHKLTVGLIFLVPGLAFALMARRDGWPLGVALSAFAAHVAVAGGWEHGGYTELVQWGLVTNVAAAVALLFVLLWLTAYLDAGRGRHAAGAALAAGFAILTNPRSLIALAVVGVGVWVAIVTRPGGGSVGLATATRRLALVGAAAAALAAPELAALLRYADLYEFVHYEFYEGTADYLANAVRAVSWPVFALGLVGVVAARWLPARTATRAAAVTLPLYGVVTLLFALRSEVAALAPQLEATRLMPFQRLLTIYLAAVALHVGLGWLARRVGRFGGIVVDAAPLLAVAGLLVAFVAPAGGAAPEPALPPVPGRGLYPVVDTVAPAQADFRAAIEAADAAAPTGTALLVLGSGLSWHQRLWAPLWTDRSFFYDNWLWYWQPRHAGPPGYDFANGHSYPAPWLALDPTYLARHGIGGVAVTGEAKPYAEIAGGLRPVRAGLYDAYVVDEPTTIVTFDGTNAASVAVDGGRIVATGASEGGEALIRQNWFPRWKATVNGASALVTRRDDGYMSVPIPAGHVRLELVYGADGIDWLARSVSALGAAAIGVLLVAGGRRSRRVGGGRRSGAP